MWQALHDAWWRLATQIQPRSFSDALACGALDAGSVAYQAAVALRNAAYDRGWARAARLPCRVVSVGNVTVGGSGKTACVELIAGKLLAMGKRVAVLSRGYGGARQPYALRWDQQRLLVEGRPAPGPDGLADEPQLLARRLAGVPILVGRQRQRTGATACREFAADVVVLDDGFQHRRLRRDCDLVLINSRMPLEGWALLPRGPMRERLASLARAHVIILTKTDEAWDTLEALRERLRTFNRDAAFAVASHEPTAVLEPGTGCLQDPKTLAGVRVGLVSSIGDPHGFEATVRRLQATIVWHRVWPDHHRYRPQDWRALRAQADHARPDALLTTEKDWVRLEPVIGQGDSGIAPLRVLQVRMALRRGEDGVDARLAGLWAR